MSGERNNRTYRALNKTETSLFCSENCDGNPPLLYRCSPCLNRYRKYKNCGRFDVMWCNFVVRWSHGGPCCLHIQDSDIWLIDLRWVRDLMLSMHLGIMHRPFVPHNLISAQQSPVPLPKFQMTPRLKILMSSGSKKGTQIYCPFLSKVPARESPPGFPMGPLWREMPVSRAFLNTSSRVPSKGALLRVPLHWAFSETNTPFLEPPSSIS